MAVKIFCNACQEYIRDASKVEIRNLSGDEICEQCEGKIKGAYDDIDKISRRAIVQIEKARDQYKASLERAWKKVIKADDKE